MTNKTGPSYKRSVHNMVC